MSDYRPICDTWILARPKIPFHGAYPSGFLGRARALLCREDEPLLHVCGGRAKDYPFSSGLGPHDRTIDLDPDVKPDFLLDVRRLGAEPGDLFPLGQPLGTSPEVREVTKEMGPPHESHLWPAALIDRPYTAEDAAHYAPGVAGFPDGLNDLLKRTLSCVRLGGRVGVLDYIWPQPPKKGVRLVACIGVICGFNNRMRVFSVFERECLPWRKTTGAGKKAADGKTLMESLDPDPEEAEGLLAALDARQTSAEEEHDEGGPLVNPSPAQIALVSEAAERVATAKLGADGKYVGPATAARPKTEAGKALQRMLETPVSLAPSSRGTGVCVACGGSGVSSKGTACVPCGGAHTIVVREPRTGREDLIHVLSEDLIRDEEDPAEADAKACANGCSCDACKARRRAAPPVSARKSAAADF